MNIKYVSNTALFVLLLIGTIQAQNKNEVLFEANNAYNRMDFGQCVKHYEEAIELGLGDKDLYYNAACCASLNGNIAKAFGFLDMAVEDGYRTIDWIQKDPDLKLLQKDNRWPAMLDKVQANFDAYLKTINAEVYEMFRMDQEMRTSPTSEQNPDAILGLGRQNRDRIKQLLKDGELKAADDYYYAAMIFQQGLDSSHYSMAYDLATKAYRLDPDHTGARWLAAASKDRFLWSTGKPQWYGTQSNLHDGTWTLEPIDTTAVTDNDRARMCVPPLRVLIERIDKRNK